MQAKQKKNTGFFADFYKNFCMKLEILCFTAHKTFQAYSAAGMLSILKRNVNIIIIHDCRYFLMFGKYFLTGS